MGVNKRIGADAALNSEYLENVRDERMKNFGTVQHEKFEFEDIEITAKKLRGMILDEIMAYNPDWKDALKIKYKEKSSLLKKRKKERANSTKNVSSQKQDAVNKKDAVKTEQ